MQALEEKHHVSMATKTVVAEEKFIPTGAIAFFIALVILGLIIWFGIYFLMLQRA